VVLRTGRYAPPVAVHVRRQRLALQIADLPAMGYVVLVLGVADRDHADPAEAGHGMKSRGVRLQADHADSARSIENDLVRVNARGDGSVDVLDKRSGATYRAFAVEDVGDVGDEYNYAPPENDTRIANAAARDVVVERRDAGALAQSLRISYRLPVPAAAAPDRRARARETTDLRVVLSIALHAGSPAVRASMRVENRAKDHRLRVLCDAGAAIVTAHRADSAFAVVERPRPKPVPAGPLVETVVESAPMQSIADAGDASRGAMIVADGLPEYEVVDAEAGCAVAVTLIRAVGDLSRDDFSTRRGHAGPGLATPGAQCQGAHEFHLAFVPRAAPPSAGEMLHAARGFLSPPRLYQIAGGDGTLPPSGSFLEIHASDDVVLSACKPSRDGRSAVVRLFNAAGAEERVDVSAHRPIQGAYMTNLAEDRVRELAVVDNRATLTLGAHRIETIEIVFGAALV